MARDKDDIDFLKHQIELLKELVRELQKENEVLKNGQYLRNPARHRDTRRQSLSVGI